MVEVSTMLIIFHLGKNISVSEGIAKSDFNRIKICVMINIAITFSLNNMNVYVWMYVL